MTKNREQEQPVTGDGRLRGQRRREAYAARTRLYADGLRVVDNGVVKRSGRGKPVRVMGVQIHPDVAAIKQDQPKPPKGKRRRSAHKGRRETF